MAKSARRSTSHKPPPLWSRLPTAWQWIIGVAAGVGAIATAIATVPKALDVAEPWTPATHGHVKTVVGPVQQQTDVLLYWRMQDQQARAKADEGGWAVQLQKEKDPEAQRLIQKQIDHAKDEQRKIEARTQQLKVPEWVK